MTLANKNAVLMNIWGVVVAAAIVVVAIVARVAEVAVVVVVREVAHPAHSIRNHVIKSNPSKIRESYVS